MGFPKITLDRDAFSLYVLIPATHRPVLDRYAAKTGLSIREAASLLLRISLAQFEELEQEKGPAENWAHELDRAIAEMQNLDRRRRAPGGA
jgi:hypothetical protein